MYISGGRFLLSTLAFYSLYTNDGKGNYATANEAKTVWGGDLSNRPTTTYAIGGIYGANNVYYTWSGAYAVGDINGDGKADLLGATDALQAYFGNGVGGFAAAVSADASVANAIAARVVAISSCSRMA